MAIIAFSGLARAGKDSGGSVLIKKYGFTRIAFADDLKNLCARVFYMDPSQFEDEAKDTRITRVHLDFHDIDNIRTIVESEWGYEIPYENREAMEELHGTEYDTPRDILRSIGMMLRNHVDKDIWTNRVLNKIREHKGNIVITDCRFENEREMLHKIGAVLCLVKRGEQTMQEHEFSLGEESEYDVIFTNNGTLYEYQSSVDMWYNTKKNEFDYYRVWKYE